MLFFRLETCNNCTTRFTIIYINNLDVNIIAWLVSLWMTLKLVVQWTVKNVIYDYSRILTNLANEQRTG